MDVSPQLARELFQEAIENHSPDQWDDYLAQACNGDTELRRRVEALLRGHNRANQLLDQPVLSSLAESDRVIEGPGTSIGPYKLLEQIGSGGFGVVFMAEQQQPVRRKVALKIVKPGMDTRQVVARFEAERQALALMDHPNIAHVFDGGQTESGRPYFVMELVRGIPITEYCEQNRLPMRDRLELFVNVCQAVQHAHQKGIIHRDLKPSNVMVTQHDVTPVVKIIDFGIAKATGIQLTDKTLFTNFAQFVGTPMYMSPEQARMSGLDVDTRSDVYSLGVLLYELTTGTTPFDKQRLQEAAYDEMIRIIREEEPVKPSTRLSTLGRATITTAHGDKTDTRKLVQSVRGELDWIVMKALEKDRNRRYESAGAFAADVQRFLQNETVLACPPSAWYRLRKTARRHQAALAAALAVFLALTAGAAIAVWQAVVATQAKQQALEAAANQKKAKEAAEARELETKAVLDFVEWKIMSAARPTGQAGGLGRDVTLQHAIEAAVPFVQEKFKDQPLIEARLRMVLAQSFGYLGDEPKSGEQYEAARALYAQHLGPDHEETLRSMNGLAVSYSVRGLHADAYKLEVETLAAQRDKLGSDHFDTLRTMHNLAHSLDNLGRYAEALKLREENLATRLRVLGRDDLWTCDSLSGLATTYGYLGRYSEAHPLFEEVVARRTEKLGPEHPDTLRSMFMLASSYAHLERHDEALKLGERTLDLQTRKLGADHPDTLRTRSDVAASYYSLRRYDDALALYQETLRQRNAILGPDHPDTLSNMYNVALVYSALGRHQDALVLRQENLTRRKAVLGSEHPHTLMSMNDLAASYSYLGRDAEAAPLHQETLTLRRAALGSTHPNTLHSMHNLAKCYLVLNRGAEAIPLIDECVQLSRGKEVNPRMIASALDMRLRHFEQGKDAAGCRATSELWASLGTKDKDMLYDWACTHAVTAAVIKAGDAAGEGDRQATAEADRAMEVLKRAVTAGYRNHAHMSKDTDLDALRSRPDFKQLMSELQSKTPSQQ